VTDLHTLLAWLSGAVDWLNGDGPAVVFVTLYLLAMFVLVIAMPVWFWGYDKGRRDLQDRDADAWRFGYAAGYRDHEWGSPYAIEGETVRHIILMRTEKASRP
jgi:hypothetical protein